MAYEHKIMLTFSPLLCINVCICEHLSNQTMSTCLDRPICGRYARLRLVTHYFIKCALFYTQMKANFDYIVFGENVCVLSNEIAHFLGPANST